MLLNIIQKLTDHFYSNRNFEEFHRLSFPSDYSKPKAPEDYKEKQPLENLMKDFKIEPLTSIIPPHKMQALTKGVLKISKSAQDDKIPVKKKENTKSRGRARKEKFKESKPKVASNVSQSKMSSKRFLSKLSFKASENSLEFLNEVAEDSEYDTKTSKIFKKVAKQVTIRKSSSKNEPSKVSKKKEKAPHLYGVLGVDRLNADDNILMRSNINSRKENSLSLATNYIPKSKLLEQEAEFNKLIHKYKVATDAVDKELKRKQRLNDFKSVSLLIL